MVKRYDLLFSTSTSSLLRHNFSKAPCTTSRASSSCRRFLRIKRYTLSAYLVTHSLYSLSVIKQFPVLFGVGVLRHACVFLPRKPMHVIRPRRWKVTSRDIFLKKILPAGGRMSS